MFPLPDSRGRFGIYGGRYVPETLIPALDELTEAYRGVVEDPDFQREFNHYLETYVGRPSLLTFAANLTERCGGAKIYLKREDLNHTGAHKINNTIGQALLAKRMGKKRVIAETGAGQHGVATATAAALFNLDCIVYMGEEDVRRQALNVFRMKLLGAEVRPVTSGTRTLKDATNEAIRDWVTNVRTTFYIIGSVVGPHPYPMIVRDLQSVIGREIMGQLEQLEGRRVPDAIVACVGGGSNAIGIFAPFAYLPAAERPRLIGVEAAGHGLDGGAHAASISARKRGVLHGALMYLLSDRDGQISPAHSVSAGLDYPGVGPEHSYYADEGIAEYASVDDAKALSAFRTVSELEGIIPALETAHAFAYVMELAPNMRPDQVVVINLSGRGDKDVNEAMRVLELSDGGGIVSRIAATFETAQRENRAAFIPYLTAGYPDEPRFLQAAQKLLEVADLLEVGLPYSDPLGDGPTIQRSSEAALNQGVTTAKVFELIARLRQSSDKPLVLMTYYNPIYCYPSGEAGFLKDLKAAGGDGVILPDLPADEADTLVQAAHKLGIDTIFLVAPTSTDERLRVVTAACSGFIYAVSVTGVTGARDQLPEDVPELVRRVKAVSSLPVAVGFGVSGRQTARPVAEVADGVVVGSALIRALAENRDITPLAEEIAQACQKSPSKATSSYENSWCSAVITCWALLERIVISSVTDRS